MNGQTPGGGACTLEGRSAASCDRGSQMRRAVAVPQNAQHLHDLFTRCAQDLTPRLPTLPVMKWILAALATACLGGASLFLLDFEPPQTEPEETGVGQPGRRANREAPLEVRVAQLKDEIRQLRGRLGRERVGALARWEGAREYDDARDPEDPTAAGPLEQTVRSIVEDQRVEERERRDERRRQAWTERVEERLDTLVGAVNLSAEHREAIGNLWTAERDQIGVLFSEARAGERDFREARQSVQGLREETDREVQSLLSEDQYTAYAEMRQEDRRGGRGGWRGRGGEGRGPRQP